MKKKTKMILPADISYAIKVVASRVFYDDELPVITNAINDIGYYESYLIQAGIEKNLSALGLGIDDWLGIYSDSKKLVAGNSSKHCFNLRLPQDLSILIKTLQIMTRMDFWQIYWHGTSHCVNKLFDEGKKEDFQDNLILVYLHLRDKDSPVDIDSITWNDIKE